MAPIRERLLSTISVHEAGSQREAPEIDYDKGTVFAARPPGSFPTTNKSKLEVEHTARMGSNTSKTRSSSGSKTTSYSTGGSSSGGGGDGGGDYGTTHHGHHGHHEPSSYSDSNDNSGGDSGGDGGG
ncbi:hypothetical protein BD410DRAFT_786472, partial [Rickenella mellea]